MTRKQRNASASEKTNDSNRCRRTTISQVQQHQNSTSTPCRSGNKLLRATPETSRTTRHHRHQLIKLTASKTHCTLVSIFRHRPSTPTSPTTFAGSRARAHLAGQQRKQSLNAQADSRIPATAMARAHGIRGKGEPPPLTSGILGMTVPPRTPQRTAKVQGSKKKRPSSNLGCGTTGFLC